MFCSRKFMVSCLILSFLDHFEFILVYGVMACCNFINLHVAAQFPQNNLLKRLSFFPLNFFCTKSIGLISGCFVEFIYVYMFPSGSVVKKLPAMQKRPEML